MGIILISLPKMGDWIFLLSPEATLGKGRPYDKSAGSILFPNPYLILTKWYGLNVHFVRSWITILGLNDKLYLW